MKTRTIIIDESTRPHVTDDEIVVHRGAALAGHRASAVVIRYLCGPLLARDLDWLNHAVMCKVVPAHVLKKREGDDDS